MFVTHTQPVAARQGTDSVRHGYGRFLQVDPLGYDGDINLYGYVANNPVNNVDPDGQACMALNSSSPYCTRSYLYDKLDALHGHKTSFFAAAAVTNRALANLDYPFAPIFVGSVGSEAKGFLEGLGRGLYASNLRLVGDLGPDKAQNDHAFVRREQSIVQRHLDAFQKRSPEAYKEAISKINSAMAGWPTLLRKFDPIFARAIDQVREANGGKFDFANERHRVALGDAVIRGVNDAEGTCTGRIALRCR